MANYFIDHHKFSSYTPADMANTKSAIKKIRRISKQTVVNKARKSRFRNALKKMNLLIDQNFISGIGNIYASEILFLSKINPAKKAKNLTKNDCRQILKNSIGVLRKAINKGGSSIKDFKNTSGKQGGFQSEFKVYQREGLKCKRVNCKGIIRKKNISNRSTFFCNSCQK